MELTRQEYWWWVEATYDDEMLCYSEEDIGETRRQDRSLKDDKIMPYEMMRSCLTRECKINCATRSCRMRECNIRSAMRSGPTRECKIISTTRLDPTNWTKLGPTRGCKIWSVTRSSCTRECMIWLATRSCTVRWMRSLVRPSERWEDKITSESVWR